MKQAIYNYLRRMAREIVRIVEQNKTDGIDRREKRDLA